MITPKSCKLIKDGQKAFVHARWLEDVEYSAKMNDMIINSTGEQCSHCKWINKGGIDKRTKYCPDCGATMDLEKE